MVSAPVRRCQVAFAEQRGLSVRRACALLSVARSAMGYESRLAQRDAPVLAAMRELAAQYPRYGYRRIQVFLGRRGHLMSADRAHRRRQFNEVRPHSSLGQLTPAEFKRKCHNPGSESGASPDPSCAGP
jgi:transposase InsO family protein